MRAYSEEELHAKQVSTDAYPCAYQPLMMRRASQNENLRCTPDVAVGSLAQERQGPFWILCISDLFPSEAKKNARIRFFRAGDAHLVHAHGQGNRRKCL
jgi:hypothetical protein